VCGPVTVGLKVKELLSGFGIMSVGGHEVAKNMLGMIPSRACRWYISKKTNNCVIRKKRYPSGPNLYQRFFLRLLKRDLFFRIHLDEYGSNIFRLVDGERDVERIGFLVKKRFGKAVEPLYPRISAFLINMESNGLIRFKGGGDHGE